MRVCVLGGGICEENDLLLQCFRKECYMYKQQLPAKVQPLHSHLTDANVVPEGCVVKRGVAMLVGKVHVWMGPQYLEGGVARTAQDSV